jgi:wobble nucleotide-excising tRNase
LSCEFKDIGKRGRGSDTLYFNAFTEDLFDWDNDLEDDHERLIKFKSHSQFFKDLDGMGIEEHIRRHLHRHADFNFTINFANEEIRFFRDVVEDGHSRRAEDIKISRGEENLFVWCFFMAILQLAVEAGKGQPYDWVRYVYIDDPITSLDEHNTVTVASDLARVIKETKNGVKFVISTHHGLFFNVMFNELKGKKTPDTADTSEEIRRKAYILHRRNDALSYTLHDTSESPFLYHVAALAELKAAAKAGKISQYHFNLLRSILEKTAVFFGSQHISACFSGHPKRSQYARYLNVRSHAKYSVFEAEPIHSVDKKNFREILNAFLDRNHFVLPDVVVKRRRTT